MHLPKVTPTAGVRLSDDQICAITALAQREFEPETKTTMVSCLEADETRLDTGYRATRTASGAEAYELTERCNDVLEGGQESPLPILMDGDTLKQVGAVSVSQDGRAIAKFSRSENGQKAMMAFSSGDAALTVAYLNRGAGRRAAALSLRTVTDGKRQMEAKMSDHLEIYKLGQKYNRTSQADEAIKAGKSITDFRSELLDAIGSKPFDAPAIHSDSKRDYSIGAILRAQVTGDWKNAGYEREMSQEATRSYPGQARGLVVPASAILGKRATMTTGGSASGSVSTDHDAGMFIDKLRSASSVLEAGATVVSGVERNFTVPKLAADATASWLAEGVAVSDSAVDVGSISMSMKRVSASQTFTREALLQSQPSVDEIVRRSIGTTLMQAIDLAGLEGTGTGGQPTGVANTSGVNTLTAAAGGTLTYAEALTALGAIEADNIATDRAAWIMNPLDYARIANTAVDAGSGQFVIDPKSSTLLGRRVIQTTKASAGSVYLGVWEQLLVALFGGVDLIVDPYTNATSAKIAITSHMLADVNVRHAEAFNVITLTP